MAAMAAVAQPPPAAPIKPATTPTVALNTVASAPPQTAPAAKLPPASVTTKQTKLEFFTVLKKRGPVGTDKIERVDGQSSQPWSSLIGSHPGYSAFAQPETALEGFNLISVGANPQH
jgi:hypothetical protein